MTDSLSNFVSAAWPIILALIALIVAWTKFGTRLSESEARIGILEGKITQSDEKQNQIMIQLSQIQADLLWIRRTLDQTK